MEFIVLSWLFSSVKFCFWVMKISDGSQGLACEGQGHRHEAGCQHA